MKKISLVSKQWRSKLIAAFLSAVLAMVLTGCGNSLSGTAEPDETPAGNSGAGSSGESPGNLSEETVIRIGSLKGPTSMGLLPLQKASEAGEAEGQYEFQMVTAADELLPLMVKGSLDIALVPADVAAVLYQKTESGVTVIDINTLGVLYMISGDLQISGPEDLKGRTIYLTGKGTTPDYVLHYILRENGLNEGDYTLEYKSEPTEVAVLLAENPDATGLLPQPFVTAACSQNEALAVVMDMNEEWNKLQQSGGSSMVTGVTVVRSAFLKEQEEAVKTFLAEHKVSAAAINRDVETGAALAAAAGIIAQEAIGVKAIPQCNITYIDGEEMKQALSGYLKVLYEQNPESVGGSLPADDFYYIP